MKLPGTPIAWPLRLWFVFEVVFGVGAVLTIGLSPGSTASNFAWPVQPVVMAAVLGAYYFSSALLFVLPLFARRWEMIRVMVLPTALFSLAELGATLLHWDKFSVGSAPFTIWLLSYVLPPPIFVGGYLFQEWQARRRGTVLPPDPLAPDARRALLHWGALLTALAVGLFVFPQMLIPHAPWTMTPLTVRALAGWLLAAGALMLSMARENHRAGVLVGVPLLLLMFPAVTVQLARFPAEVSFGNVALFALYGIMLVAFALGVHLARGKWREALG